MRLGGETMATRTGSDWLAGRGAGTAAARRRVNPPSVSHGITQGEVRRIAFVRRTECGSQDNIPIPVGYASVIGTLGAGSGRKLD